MEKRKENEKGATQEIGQNVISFCGVALNLLFLVRSSIYLFFIIFVFLFCIFIFIFVVIVFLIFFPIIFIWCCFCLLLLLSITLLPSSAVFAPLFFLP